MFKRKIEDITNYKDYVKSDIKGIMVRKFRDRRYFLGIKLYDITENINQDLTFVDEIKSTSGIGFKKN